MSQHVRVNETHRFTSRRGAALAVASVACLLAHSAVLSAQVVPSQAATPSPVTTQAQARATISALDARVADHPKQKAAVAPAKPSAAATVATTTAAPRTRAVRAPLPALNASGAVKKDKSP